MRNHFCDHLLFVILSLIATSQGCANLVSRKFLTESHRPAPYQLKCSISGESNFAAKLCRMLLSTGRAVFPQN